MHGSNTPDNSIEKASPSPNSKDNSAKGEIFVFIPRVFLHFGSVVTETEKYFCFQPFVIDVYLTRSQAPRREVTESLFHAHPRSPAVLITQQAVVNM